MRSTLLRRFLAGTRRASPVAWCVLATVLSLPPRRGKGAASVRFRRPMLPSPYGCARPSVSLTFEATFAFTVVTARWLVISPRETLSIGFRVLVSLHPAIQTTGLLTLAPAGLSPAEHTSLRWTHNRTCRSPASGSRTRLHALLSHATPSAISEHSSELIGCPISRSFSTQCVCLELRSLPSTGITQLPRYYEPLRHPKAPSLSLTGFRLVVADHALGLPVLRALFLCTCCRHYPGAATGRVVSLIRPSRISLPRKPCRVGLRIVLFEVCSAFTRVTACTLALSPYIVTR
jgi:hypothetical protein